MRVNYDGEQVDEEYEVCFDDEEDSFLFDTESAAMACIKKFELSQDDTIYYLYLLTTYYDAFGDKGLTKSKLIYRTGEQLND